MRMASSTWVPEDDLGDWTPSELAEKAAAAQNAGPRRRMTADHDERGVLRQALELIAQYPQATRTGEPYSICRVCRLSTKPGQPIAHGAACPVGEALAAPDTREYEYRACFKTGFGQRGHTVGDDGNYLTEAQARRMTTGNGSWLERRVKSTPGPWQQVPDEKASEA